MLTTIYQQQQQNASGFLMVRFQIPTVWKIWDFVYKYNLSLILFHLYLKYQNLIGSSMCLYLNMTIERAVIVEGLGTESALIGRAWSPCESNFFVSRFVGLLQLVGVLVAVTELEVKVKLEVLLERLFAPEVALQHRVQILQIQWDLKTNHLNTGNIIIQLFEVPVSNGLVFKWLV